MFEHKPAWSEEDENIYKRLLEILHDCHAYGRYDLRMDEHADLKKWLKSLKERYTWKPSEEQLKTFEYYLDADISNKDREVLFGLYKQLKQL